MPPYTQYTQYTPFSPYENVLSNFRFCNSPFFIELTDTAFYFPARTAAVKRAAFSRMLFR